MRHLSLLVLSFAISGCSVDATLDLQCSSDCETVQGDCHDQCVTECADASHDGDAACDTDCRKICDDDFDSCSFSCSGNG